MEWVRTNGETPYEKWAKLEDIPIHQALAGVDDVTDLPRRPWGRTGGLGTFIELLGTYEMGRTLYIAEIPDGAALEPERHMYDEAIFILQGRGLTEVWREGEPKVTFEWSKGSLFAPPINTWHRLVNGSREPALFLGFTTAPQVMNALYDSEIVFNCDYQFTGRFGGQPEYFGRGKERYKEGRATIWETNFIPDAFAEFLDPGEYKVAGGQMTTYRMAGDFPNGHMSEWPVGRYHKAHYHGPGALLIGLRGKGYVPLWPRELGIHPYQDGHEDQVVTVNWGTNSIYVPPNGWYHQHMNAGKEPARHIAFYASRPSRVEGGEAVVTTSYREGGTLIEYEDEDPEIRRRFVEALAIEGVECTMPPVVYRQ